MKHTIKQLIILTCILVITGIGKAQAQNNAQAIAAADSSRFSINSGGGWQLYNSYVAQHNTDSVRLELIVQHANNIVWNNEQYVGKIKMASLQPATDRTISFSLLNDVYTVRVETNGKCYLKLSAGSVPSGTMTVLPVFIYYRK